MTITALRAWERRQWLTAGAASMTTLLVMGLPADLIPNPVFGRQIAAPWWAWPVLAVTAVLSGLLFATYVRPTGGADADPLADRQGRRGLAGSVLTFFAVGCPVCNKVVLLALGYSGAVRYFEPVQPLLAVGAIGLLGWALRARLRGQLACAVSPAPAG
ncbi:MAG: hypothetical protein R2731_07065 [Nocardioides sp.]